MVSKIFVLVGALCVINLTSALKAPFITPCKSDDSECAKKNADSVAPQFADGLPDYGVETLDPAFFKFVDASSPNLKFLLNDITVTGLKGCKPHKMQVDSPKSKMYLKLECTIKMDGDYVLNGRVLILNIEGKGKIHVFLRKLLIDVDMDVVEKVGKDGEKYFRVKKFKHTYELKDKSDVVFEGLFENNAVLSQAANELITNNGNDIVNEIGGGMFEAAVKRVVEQVNNFFSKVPINELVLPA